jgi:hypothetical protein
MMYVNSLRIIVLCCTDINVWLVHHKKKDFTKRGHPQNMLFDIRYITQFILKSEIAQIDIFGPSLSSYSRDAPAVTEAAPDS